MHFEITGEIRDPETIATGKTLRDRKRLEKAYGRARWRKRKGTAAIQLSSGEVRNAEIHWYEASGIGARVQDQALREMTEPMADPTPRFVICVGNIGYPASLETRKVYQAIPDPVAAKDKLIRVIDESGEDYLYPEALFVPVELSGEATDAILRAS